MINFLTKFWTEFGSLVQVSPAILADLAFVGIVAGIAFVLIFGIACATVRLVEYLRGIE
jgi:hypothetical protein